MALTLASFAPPKDESFQWIDCRNKASCAMIGIDWFSGLVEIFSARIARYIVQMRPEPPRRTRNIRRVDDVLRTAYEKYDRSAETKQLLHLLLR